MIRKTKIIATIGPASQNGKTIEQMIAVGVNVFRLNFSHGDHDDHKKSIDLIRAASAKKKIPVGIIQDLCGPKIRTGDFSTESITLKKGKLFTLTTDAIIGDDERVSVNYKKLPREVERGNYILLDDGSKKLYVKEVKGNDIVCRVVIGGVIKGRRGINVPGADLSVSALTTKDKKDLAFGLKQGVDFVALSFVRSAKDILGLKRILKREGSNAMVLAKIETKEAVERIDDIIDVTDAMMVARGDLAVEISAEQVPIVQKMIVEKCNQKGRPVVVATQMLESMILAPVPTRAEVSDVANSILDGADAVMLSGETAVGVAPVEPVKVMHHTAKRIESSYLHPHVLKRNNKSHSVGIVDAIGRAVVNTARDVDAKVIVTLTESGFTPRMISRYRPSQPIIVMTPSEVVARQVTISFGCYPDNIRPFTYVVEVMDIVREYTIKKKYAKRGDRVVLAAGVPFGSSGGTNIVLIETI